MIPHYGYCFLFSYNTTPEAALRNLLSRASPFRCVRLVFFFDINSEEEFSRINAIMLDLAQAYFESTPPAITLVAQAPLNGDAACEVTSLEDDKFSISPLRGNKGVVVTGEDYCEIIAGGISSGHLKADAMKQSEDAFSMMGNILCEANAKKESIVRQWNYIENITGVGACGQNYQIFNDLRSEFYDGGSWNANGYPSATGIGAASGGIIVDFNAVVESKVDIFPIDNPLQIAAHSYSEVVLAEGSELKSTPKFERGKAVSDDFGMIFYLSGTAAIRGERSSLTDDARCQTIMTIENIQSLISVENQIKYHLKHPLKVNFCMLRVYIKRREDYTVIRKVVEEKFGELPVLYLFADICREELLVEIEGIATSFSGKEAGE